MADVENKLLEEKEESGGLGTLIGLGAAATIPFLRPFRNISKVKRALDTVNRENVKRTAASEVLTPIIKTPKTGLEAFRAPTKINYGKQVKAPSPTTNINPLVNDRENILRNEAVMSFAEKNPQSMFGSALYDQIKMFPKDKATPDEWLKFFNQKKGVKYNDGRSASIDAEELFDTNIAALDKSGNLVGGLFKTAKDMNMAVDKNTLLAQVRQNPFNKLELRRYMSPTGVDDSVEGMIGEAEKIKRILGTKYLDETGTPITQNLINNIDEALESMKMDSFARGQSMETLTQNINVGAKTLRESLKKSLDQISDPQDRQMINQAIRNINGLAEEGVMKIKSVPRLPQHASGSEYGTYRLEGEVAPGEFVWHFGAGKAPSGPGRHLDRYHWADAKQPVVHAMYGTRYTPQGQKVISINEIQADVQQAVTKDVLKSGKVRYNPEGREVSNSLIVDNMNAPRETIERLMKKGLYMTDDDKYQLSKAFNQLKAGRKSLRGTDAVNTESLTDYLPFFNSKNYADLALKTTIKAAGDEGAQWVSVIPVNMIARGSGAVKGNQQFYGYATGKGFQKKGEAILPELMRKLSKQYKTEAKTIQVTLSDPKRPYKIVRTRDIKRYDGDKNEPGTAVETFKEKYHSKAYKTEQDAINAGFSKSEIKFIPEGDPNLYMNTYALRISPDMIQKPMKLYKKEGGFIENVFRPL